MSLHVKNIAKVIGIIFLVILIAWSIKIFFFPFQRHMPAISPLTQAIKAQNQQWQEKIEATGSLSANQGVAVSPETSGTVTEIFFKSGQYVEKGAPLIQLDPSIDQANLDSALSQIPLDQNNYERARDLYKKNLGSKQDLDAAKAELEEAKANAAKAKAELALKSIKAPFSGQLGLRKVDLGDFLSEGSEIVNLEDTNPMRVEFTVSQKSVPLIQDGQRVAMESDAYPDRIFTGDVSAIDSTLDINTRSISVWANIPNADHALVPGSFVTVTLYVGEPQRVIVIPQQAVIYNDASDFVYLYKEGKALKRNITVIQTQGKWVSVHGIDVGDIVLTSGQNQLFDSAPVKIEMLNPDGTKAVTKPSDSTDSPKSTESNNKPSNS